MFDSGIKAKDLFDDIRNEADISIDIPDSCFVSWLNALEQMLYSEIIKEQVECNLPEVRGFVCFDEIPYFEDKESPVRYEDVHAVYAYNDDSIESVSIQLKSSTLASGAIFPNCYFKYDDKICFSDGMFDSKKYPNGRNIRIIYFVRPMLKTEANISTTNVMLPPEFIELAKSKLRGESYKLANEDGLSAKWLNDYNVLLETFKVWIQNKSPSFGI